MAASVYDHARLIFTRAFYDSKRNGDSNTTARTAAGTAVASAEATLTGPNVGGNPDYASRKAAFDALNVASWPTPHVFYGESALNG